MQIHLKREIDIAKRELANDIDLGLIITGDLLKKLNHKRSGDLQKKVALGIRPKANGYYSTLVYLAREFYHQLPNSLKIQVDNSALCREKEGVYDSHLHRIASLWYKEVIGKEGIDLLVHFQMDLAEQFGNEIFQSFDIYLSTLLNVYRIPENFKLMYYVQVLPSDNLYISELSSYVKAYTVKINSEDLMILQAAYDGIEVIDPHDYSIAVDQIIKRLTMSLRHLERRQKVFWGS